MLASQELVDASTKAGKDLEHKGLEGSGVHCLFKVSAQLVSVEELSEIVEELGVINPFGCYLRRVLS